MSEEATSWGATAKVVIWPLVAIIALFLFRPQIAALLPDVDELQVGSLSIKKSSKLGKSASPKVLTALADLPESSLNTLITRNLQVTCFTPPVIPEMVRADHARLIERGLLEEIRPAELPTACVGLQNPVFGVRLTQLGDQARDFLLGVLAQVSAGSRQKADSGDAK